MDEKKAFRRQVAAARKAASAREVAGNSRRIFEKVCRLAEYREADAVFAYMDFRNEVMTEEFIRRCWKDGKTVALPRVNGREMNFYEITSFDDLKVSSMGIREPASGDPVDAVYPRALLIVPGVAFDPRCGRIGYGGGFYDKFQVEWPQHPTVAVAFEFQVFPELPAEEYDIRPGRVITEARSFERDSI